MTHHSTLPDFTARQRLAVAKKPLALGIAMVLGIQAAPLAMAQSDTAMLGEITITARKREESLQDVPISVQALGPQALEELGVQSFEDYALLLPSVSFKSNGVPGSATVFMRGVSDGGDGNSSGSQPSVAIYLDEQPVTAIAANLDIHIYDMARIEALAGPQGTLFGASAQSGALRIITNKPNTDAFEGRIDVGVGSTKGGSESYSFEGFANIPLGEKAAIRLVGWSLKEGGWVDNVAGTRNYQLEGGYGYNPNNFGRTSSIDNASLVKEDFNELDKTGLRAALKVDLSDTWSLNASIIHQNMETDGVWEVDPINTGSEESIQRFSQEFSEDKFTQFAVSVEGEVMNHLLTYSGSSLDRDTQYQTDYSKYGEDAYFVPYYACDYSASGPDLNTQTNTDCTSLYEYFTSDDDYKRTSHELRLQSIGEGRFSYTVGAFWQKSEHDYLNLWIQPGMSPTLQVGGYDINGVYFRTDQQRTDTQFALFGELYIDLTDSLRATLGVRHYDEESEVKGVVGWGPGVFCTTNPDCRETFVDSKADFSDQLFKFSLAWNLSDDKMMYATYAEGYRPGGVNRDPGLIATAGTQTWEPDELKNYELGWKTSWADNRLRWNGAVYFMDWDKVQYTIYDFSLSACCGNVYNLSTAEIKGLETDISWVAGNGFSLSAAYSFNDAKTTADFTIPSGRLAVPKGTELPNIPESKFSLQGRYEFNLGQFDAYSQLAMSYTDGSWSQIRPSSRLPQDAYTLVNLSAGIRKDNWGIDVHVNNLTDEVADYFVKPRTYEYSVVTNRPQSFGARFWMSF
ncbi:MAG: TonB-dependent receptor [Steroidobacteraceae bacterium]